MVKIISVAVHGVAEPVAAVSGLGRDRGSEQRQAVFTGVKRNGGTQHDMIMACGPTKGQYSEYTYEFSCPQSPKAELKPPRDLSKGLQSAAADAANADAKNRQTLGALSQQHQQSVETNVARYKADIQDWCASHAQRCDAQCTNKSRGSTHYMNACVDLCSSVVDACVTSSLDQENKRAQAEARVRAANANIAGQAFGRSCWMP